MDQQTQQGLAWLERRSRQLTGAVLAVVALVATYGLLIFEGQQGRPAFHVYPWLAAVLFYFAGDLLAYIWFKVVSMRLLAVLKVAEQRARDQASASASAQSASPPRARPSPIAPPEQPAGEESQ